MNLYKEKILKHSLKGQRRANHKYLYIDENGRYVYPEDVSKANNIQKHHAQVLSDRRIAKKDRAHVKEDKEITNAMRKELNNMGYNIGKKDSEQLRRNINTNSQIQSAHQRSVKTIKGTYDQERRAANPEAAKAEITERRRKKESSTRPLRVADQQASAHQGSISLKNNSNGTKDITRRVSDADTGKAIIKERREKRRKNLDQQRKSAHAGYELDKKMYPDGGSTEELERQKEKTANRKKAKETISRTEAGIEAARKRRKKKPTVKGSKKVTTWDNANVKRW